METKPLVLIVEDNHINALVLKKSIAAFCQTVHVVNDEGVFAALTAHNYDIILMDINLGGNSMDGEAIMKMLKKDARYAQIPIFAVTSYAMPGDRDRFLSAGFDKYIPKPIDRHAVIQEIQASLGQSNV